MVAWRTTVLLAGVVLFVAGLTGCGGDSTRTYSVDEVLNAFAVEGYPLVEVRPEGLYLAPRNDEPLIVQVLTDREAEEAWSGFVTVGAGDGSLTVRRANVLAISDVGLTSDARAHVRSAMAALPDRGVAVDSLEER